MLSQELHGDLHVVDFLCDGSGVRVGRCLGALELHLGVDDCALHVVADRPAHAAELVVIVADELCVVILDVLLELDEDL